ncbi:metallophosphoesterase family protein [Halorussus halobius]|uniref:metallophosphoesterase family protein n=1 Tax=Halorussus halobius TaxID=1710537 RepID=UPI00109218AF|nr:metallophosphoesterase family protein [Halorussus halobius]
MPRIALVSDTHVPSRADAVPAWVADRVRAADHTVHAGDLDSPDAYETVVDLADGDLTAVAGNMDPASLDLPEVATLDVEGVRFVVTHGIARSSEEYVATITEAVETRLDGEGVAVAGHTHALVDDEMAGVRFLNPGSATGADPAERATMLTVEVGDGEVDVTAYEDDEEVDVGE